MTVSEAVEALGGSKSVADLLGIHRNTVINWKTQGYITGPKILDFWELCKKYKLDIKLTDLARKKK